MSNQYQNEIDKLPPLDDYSFENIFTVHQDGEHYFYNLLRTINFPEDIDSSLFVNYRVKSNMPLTTLSYNVYNTPKLWWLIVLVNRIDNPISFIKPGTLLKVVKPEQVNEIIQTIKSQLI